MNSTKHTRAKSAVVVFRLREKMRAIKVEAHKSAVVVEIGNSLDDLQKAVDGYIEIIYPFSDAVGLLCNEEAKLNGLELNRALYDADGNIYDIVAGTFYVVGLGEEDLTDLTDEMTAKYLEIYKTPQSFYISDGHILVI